ncbi:hypothetical protein Emag_006146 [Eimeria magna]
MERILVMSSPLLGYLVAHLIPFAANLMSLGSLAQEHLKQEAGEQVYQPRDFALLLEGFPPDATCEDEIARFVYSSLLLNQPPESVVKVVIGFDTRHYEEHRRLHESLEHKLNRLKLVGYQIRYEVLVVPVSSRPRNTGYAVVVCKYAQGWALRWNLHRNLKTLFGRISAFRGPNEVSSRAPSLSKTLRLEEVLLPAPGNVHSLRSVCAAKCRFDRFSAVVNAAIHGNQCDEDALERRLFVLGKSKLHFLGAAEGVSRTSRPPLVLDPPGNPCLWVCVIRQSMKERHKSRTGEQVAFMMRLTITYTITTCLTYIFILHDARWWFVRGGLIECVAMQLLSFLFSEVGLSLLQVPWLIRVFRRNCLVPLRKGPMSQSAFNQLYEGPDFCTPTKYAAMLQGVCTLFLYVGIAPFLAVQAMLTWAILYWIYKISLLRIVKRPKPEMLGVVQQAEARTNTWQAMHYYKLQHVFFAKYHSTQPVYLSWGPERNPDILKEPGCTTLGTHVSATRAFEAKGAPKRARRRMGALESRGSEDENTGEGVVRRQSTAVPIDGVNIVDGESSRSSSLSSDAESSMADDLVPDPAVVRKLRATLVEGRAAPEFQRLLIERQTQRSWNPLHSARKLAAAAAAAKRKKVTLKPEPQDEEARKQKCRQGPTEHSIESLRGPRDAPPRGKQRPPYTNDVESEESHEAESLARFWQWLSSAALHQLRALACLTGGSTPCGDYATWGR